MIIGVTGYAQHGKDSAGKRLVDVYGFTRMAFADQLKSMALALDPFILEPWNGNGVLVQRLSDLVRNDGWETAKTLPEVRRFLQALGTEGVRAHIGQESWVVALEKRWLASGADNVVITDVRFPNEAEWIKRQNGVLIRVVRFTADGQPFDNGVDTSHPSEALIRTLKTDFVIQASDLPELNLALDRIAAALKLVAKDQQAEAFSS
jgi:hypothetical protein